MRRRRSLRHRRGRGRGSGQEKRDARLAGNSARHEGEDPRRRVDPRLRMARGCGSRVPFPVVRAGVGGSQGPREARDRAGEGSRNRRLGSGPHPGPDILSSDARAHGARYSRNVPPAHGRSPFATLPGGPPSRPGEPHGPSRLHPPARSPAHPSIEAAKPRVPFATSHARPSRTKSGHDASEFSSPSLRISSRFVYFRSGHSP